jgi:general secretion pathway protein D
MKCLRLAVAAILIVSLGVPSYADEAKAAYNRGVKAATEQKYDAAYQAFQQAFALKPKNPRYESAYLEARQRAAEQHIHNGVKLRSDQKLQEALAEFQRAAQIDGTNYDALQELQATAALIKKQEAEAANATPKPQSALARLLEQAEGPPELQPSPNTPITLRMTTTADNVYRTIGKLGGINVLFDLDYKPQKITIELNEVMMQEALRLVALESKTFWRPISSTAIFVSAEGKRKEFEDNVMKTFYLRNASTSAELQEVAGTLKGMLEVKQIQVNATHGSITLRGTPDQLVLAEKLVTDMDKPKSEVMIDVTVMEVSRDRIVNLGTTLPTSFTVTPVAAGPLAGAGLVKLGSWNGNNFVWSVPSVTFTALASDSNTKILQKPQLRALDNEKATLKIGDRIPVATGSFASGVGTSGVSPLVNTQFQYIDVGVNIDITPHIHSDREVTLKMSLEISTVTGEQNIGGITQPIIGQRRIELDTRAVDGEVNLLGGILEDVETKSLSGYPWILNIPILHYFFGQDDRQRTQNEIVFAITPHIVRSEQITTEDMKLIDLGSGNNIGLRYKEPKPAKTGPTPAPDSNVPQSRMRPTNGTQAQGPAPTVTAPRAAASAPTSPAPTSASPPAETAHP